MPIGILLDIIGYPGVYLTIPHLFT